VRRAIDNVKSKPLTRGSAFCSTHYTIDASEATNMEQIQTIIGTFAVPVQHLCAQANDDLQRDSGDEGSVSSDKRLRSQSPEADRQSEATILGRSHSSSPEVDSIPGFDENDPPAMGIQPPPQPPQWISHEERARLLLTLPDQGSQEHGARRYLVANERRADCYEHETTPREDWSPDYESPLLPAHWS